LPFLPARPANNSFRINGRLVERYLYLEEFQEKVLDRVPFLRSTRELKPSSLTPQQVAGD